jgi:acetylornithine deacetylase/succinyl-diaminopimelate desuccinylase-like protein
MSAIPAKRIVATLLAVTVIGFGPEAGHAQEADKPLTADAVRALAHAQRDSALTLFREFLTLPNDAAYPEDITRLVAWMEPQFAARGFQTRRIETKGSLVLFAERTFPGARKTALIYLQADGQPVDPSKWDQPDPFEPVLKKQSSEGAWEIIGWPAAADGLDPDWRIFARSASDSKGPMTQFLAAMDAIGAAGLTPDFNIKVIIDTEEELGSPHLAAAVRANRALLAANFLLIFDGPPHASNRPTVVFGARGITTITLTAHGPKTPQHSGHYGNFVPNPAFNLSRILASMKSPDGRVTIKGFYDGVSISPDARKRLAAVPDDEEAILESMGVSRADKVAQSLQEALQYPSINIRGLSAAWVGKEVRTIIPATAVAEIDIRTVKETDPERLVRLVRDHISKQGVHLIDRPPTDEERLAHPRIMTMEYKVSYGAFRSDFDAPAGLVARAGMRRLYGEEPILIRTLGGSIPIAPLVETLGIPAAIVPSVNIDNNQHSPNENIRVGNFFEGIAILLSVLMSEEAG